MITAISAVPSEASVAGRAAQFTANTTAPSALIMPITGQSAHKQPEKRGPFLHNRSEKRGKWTTWRSCIGPTTSLDSGDAR